MIQTLTKNVHCTIFTCNERILLFILSTMALLFCGEVFDLVDDVLELALGLEVKTETADGADDATNATAPEESAA